MVVGDRRVLAFAFSSAEGHPRSCPQRYLIREARGLPVKPFANLALAVFVLPFVFLLFVMVCLPFFWSSP